MFYGCKKLIKVEGNIPEGINNFSYMFYNCTSLQNVDGLKNLEVSNGEGFSWMFDECKSLQNVNELKNWDVSNGTTFENMFGKCSNLVRDKIPQNLKNKSMII